MQDIVFLAITVAFFALCVAYVRGLDRLVRQGEESESATDVADEADVADLAEVRAGGPAEVRA